MSWSKWLGGTLNVTASGGQRTQQVKLEAGHVAAVVLEPDTTGTTTATIGLTADGVTGNYIKILAQNVPVMGRPTVLEMSGVRALPGQTIQVVHTNTSARAMTLGIMVRQQIEGD